jgi:hypothetical protein
MNTPRCGAKSAAESDDETRRAAASCRAALSYHPAYGASIELSRKVVFGGIDFIILMNLFAALVVEVMILVDIKSISHNFSDQQQRRERKDKDGQNVQPPSQ